MQILSTQRNCPAILRSIRVGISNLLHAQIILVYRNESPNMMELFEHEDFNSGLHFFQIWRWIREFSNTFQGQNFIIINIFKTTGINISCVQNRWISLIWKMAKIHSDLEYLNRSRSNLTGVNFLDLTHNGGTPFRLQWPFTQKWLQWTSLECRKLVSVKLLCVLKDRNFERKFIYNNNNKLYLKKVQYSIETSLAELALHWAFCPIGYILTN